MMGFEDLVKAVTPPRLRGWVREVWARPAEREYRRQLDEIDFSLPTRVPVLSYGGLLDEIEGTLIHGGQVKVTHLAARHPEQRTAFNILYLVSSALPRHAEVLVRWAKERGVRFVLNQNGVAYPAWAGREYAEVNRPMARLLPLADHVVYQSEFCREGAELFLGAARAPWSVLWNPVDTDKFSPPAQPPEGEPWKLLAAGTHHQPYRVRAALECLAELLKRGRNAELVVAGRLKWPGGDEQVREMIQRLGIGERVRLVPAFSQDEAVELYRAAQVLLHPKFNDPCPTVPIEAMSCGVPVVGSESGGMPELVGDDGGLLVSVSKSWQVAHPLRADAMADAVERIMADWQRWSGRARSRAERLFYVRGWLSAHEEIFQGLVEHR